LTISGHLPPLYSEKEFETTLKESKEAYKILGIKNYDFLKIPATMVKDYATHELNGSISSVLKDFKPSHVFIPFPDRHIDHRIIFDSCMVASRPVGIGKNIKMVCAYETLSETHWNAPYIEPNFIPNLVIKIDDFIDKKIEALKCFESQITSAEGPRSLDAVKALSRFRGSQSGFNYGEAFSVIRSIL
jgi:LmbE family N-acetylglucosaminyl deacetylase